MAVENKDDKQIKDLLENNFPLRAIPIDFKDLNNRNLILNSSFKETFEKTEKDKENWFFIIELHNNEIMTIISTVQMYQKDNYLMLNFLETSKLYKNQHKGIFTIEYLKSFVRFRHLKGIIIPNIIEGSVSFFTKNGFELKGNQLKWKS